MNSISPTFAIPGQPGVTGTYLTPDALMTYCETRLQGLDTQIQTTFAEQQQSNAESQVISDAMDPFNANTGGWDPTKQGSGIAMIGDLQTAINQLPPGDAQNQLIALRDTIANRIDSSGNFSKMLDDPKQAQTYWNEIGGWGGKSDATIVGLIGGQADTNAIGTTEVGGWIDQMKGAATSVNNASELNMINLQALMSQRQEAIQLCTNLVQSMGDMTNKITENVGH